MPLSRGSSFSPRSLVPFRVPRERAVLDFDIGRDAVGHAKGGKVKHHGDRAIGATVGKDVFRQLIDVGNAVPYEGVLTLVLALAFLRGAIILCCEHGFVGFGCDCGLGFVLDCRILRLGRLFRRRNRLFRLIGEGSGGKGRDPRTDKSRAEE